MSIGNNTTGLQRILQAVNNLPEGGSGGVTVQRKADSFTANLDPADNTAIQATVNCGFVPDVVIIKGKAYQGESNTYYYDMVAVFPERSAGRNYLVAGTSGSYSVFEGTVEQTTNGFTMSFWAYNDDWDYVTMQRETFEYVAIKYT